jgi:hypothetical protein
LHSLSRKSGRSSIYPWYVVGLLGCGYAVSFLDRALVGVAGAPIKQGLALSDTQFGLLQGTSFVILYSLAGLPLGRLADRVDRRRMIALGILFWTLMTAACGLTGSFTTFFLARIGVGLGEASLVPAGVSLIGSLILSIREPARGPATPEAPAGLRAALAHVGAHRRAYGFLTAASCCNITIAQTQGAWTPLYFVRHFGLEPGPSAMMIGLMFVCSAPDRAVGRRRADRSAAGARRRGCAESGDGLLSGAGTGPRRRLLPDRSALAGSGGLSRLQLPGFGGDAGRPRRPAIADAGAPSRHARCPVPVDRDPGRSRPGAPLVGLLTDRLFRDEQAIGSSLLLVILVAGVAGPLLALAGRRFFVEAVARIEA